MKSKPQDKPEKSRRSEKELRLRPTPKAPVRTQRQPAVPNTKTRGYSDSRQTTTSPTVPANKEFRVEKRPLANTPPPPHSHTVQPAIRGTMSDPSHNNKVQRRMPYPDEIEMEDASGSHKRTTPDTDKSKQKKSKGDITTTALPNALVPYEFWYGFPTMETLAYEAGMPPIITKASIPELISQGYNAQEAAELLKARMSFPRVQQKLWPTDRLDNIVGQHFNLTQIPFEVEVQKPTAEPYGWLTTTSPEQLEKIKKQRIAVLGEMLQPVNVDLNQLTREEVNKRNCLVLIAKNINLTKSIAQVSQGLHDHIGHGNIKTIFFPRHKGDVHSGIANIECLNAAVYKQHVKKSTRLHHKYVEFLPHPNSLDGSAKPNDDMLQKWGFLDINTALASTVEAMQNTTSSSAPK